MCGIAGSFLSTDHQLLRAMARRLRHRGPDGSGVWMNDRVGLAATRLSLLDRDGGEQPMVSGDHAIVFNGEIYNHGRLRRDLERASVHPAGRSDTEVILRGFQSFKEPFLERLQGMYAVAITDGDDLYLARDLFGMKPLFYWASPDRSRLLFASEIKALLCCPSVQRRLDPAGLVEHATFGHTIGSRTLFAGISQVPPGGRLRATRDETGCMRIEQTRLESTRRPLALANLDEAARELVETLRVSVANHCAADHPIGAYLSGGVDSTIVAALMPRGVNRSIHTFVVSDRGDLEDVAVSRAVAEFLGTSHHTIDISLTNCVNHVVDAVLAFEAPVSPTISLVSAPAVREHVKGVLCGEGADELFAGYRIHRDPGERINLYLSSFRDITRRADLDARHWEATLSILERLVGDVWSSRRPALYEFLYEELLPNQHLVFWDRGAMAAGLEARMPYLDATVRDLALGLPWGWLATGSEGKRILRHVLRQLLPEEISELVIRRNKLAAPSALVATLMHLRRFARAMVPPKHYLHHPFRPFFPRHLQLLLFDLFVLLFLAGDGTVLDNFRIESFYSEHLRTLREALKSCTEDVFGEADVRYAD